MLLLLAEMPRVSKEGEFPYNWPCTKKSHHLMVASEMNHPRGCRTLGMSKLGGILAVIHVVAMGIILIYNYNIL